jgi:hypothetical protein
MRRRIKMKTSLLVLTLILLSSLCYPESKSVRVINDAEAKTLEALFPDSEIVKSQSFFITIGGFERVYFISIHHYFEGGQYTTFYIIKDNKVLMELPMEIINEYALATVDAIAFTDMNKDGFSDITILVSCFTGAGPDGAIPYYVATILINNRQGGFANVPAIDEDITNRLNEDDDFNSIKDIAEHVDKTYNRQQ